MASPASPSKELQPTTKRLKRTYSESSDDAPQIGRLTKKRESNAKFDNTPPPSPPAERPSIELGDEESANSESIDMKSINDEIVEAVIIQLQNTGNRPHLVKELAAILMPQLKIVQQ